MPASLTMHERDQIAQLLCQSHDQEELARIMGRSPSTISPELRPSGTKEGCFARRAHQRAAGRRRERPLMRKMDNPELNEAVRGGLAQYWSPEQIAGHLKRNPQGPTSSARSIYSWIGQDGHSGHWQSFFCGGGAEGLRGRKQGLTPPSAPIDGRPELIEQRLRLGDLEGDTILGSAGSGGLLTLVDRKSRYTIMIKIQSKEADHAQRKIRDRLKELEDKRRRSVTLDNGTEFACPSRLEKPLQLQLYYARPGCPYQRGTSDSTRRPVRQFFSEGNGFWQRQSPRRATGRESAKHASPPVPGLEESRRGFLRRFYGWRLHLSFHTASLFEYVILAQFHSIGHDRAATRIAGIHPATLPAISTDVFQDSGRQVRRKELPIMWGDLG